MRLLTFLGFKTGLNTYSDLLDLIRHQMMEKKSFVRVERENMYVSSYLNCAQNVPESSSMFGRVGEVNLVASLADIFMGGNTLSLIKQAP